MQPKAYYPLFADLNGRKCVVVGGGPIAQRKVATLLRYGARITLISPTLTTRLRQYARAGTIRYIARRFRPSDITAAWLVYACTDDQAINELVYRSATRRRVFINVVDQKPLCSFIAPSLFTRGDLTVAVSTGGASPTIAKRLRRQLQQVVGTEYIPMLKLLANLRTVAKRSLPSYQDRKRYFDQLVRGRVFALVRTGHLQQAKREALAELGRETALRNGASRDIQRVT